MKQHISVEQLRELTLKQQKELRRWWEPAEGDHVSQTNGSHCFISGVHKADCLEELETRQNDSGPVYVSRSECLPLLSIGQCIDLLKWPRIHPDWYHDWAVIATNKTLCEAEELIDALWEAVKSIL